MKLKQKVREAHSEQKQCVKLTQFKYESGLKKTRRSVFKQPAAINDIPLKIFLQKISMVSQNNESKKPQSQRQILPKFSQDVINNIVDNYSNFMTPRDAFYQPKKTVFNRFNYQNYTNYQYKNPFKPKKYPVEDKMQHPLRNIPNIGGSKNLQIVFCQRKYQDFVQKTNTQFKQFYQTTKNLSVPRQKFRRKSTTNLKRNQSQPKISKQNIYNKKKRKTSLSTYLQQFTTLQKLSEYMQKQHKLNERFLLQPAYDKSRTVLIDILVHRFQFLKRMKKKCRDVIFSILFGPECNYPLFKIHIQDYIKFIQLFISRDAEPSYVALFIYKFLFRQQQINLNKQMALKSLDLIGSTAHKHENVEIRLFKILQKQKGIPENVFQSFSKDQIFQNMFLDLLTY